MAGSELGYYPYGKPEFDVPEKTESLQSDWLSSSITDLKRDEEINELKELVTKLSGEVNRLERIVSNMGVKMNSFHNMDVGPFRDFTVILRPDDNGTFVAYVPAISGCHAWGESPQEAQAELVNVFEMIKEEYEEEGKPLPKDIN